MTSNKPKGHEGVKFLALPQHEDGVDHLPIDVLEGSQRRDQCLVVKVVVPLSPNRVEQSLRDY